MKKPFFMLVTATIIGVLLAASFGFSLKPIAHADSSNTEWQLTVTGLVEHSLDLTLTDITSMPQTTVYAQLICVGAPDSVLMEGNWTGVRLWLLLQEAGVLPETVKVAFHAQDGYTTDLAVDTALHDDVILAYERDGAPLGETLRLVVPGWWGYKWIAQVTGIDLVSYNFLGTYESLGYSDDADIKSGGTTSQLPLPSFDPNLPQSSSTSASPLSPPSPSPNPSNSSSPVPSQTQNLQSDLFLPMDTLCAMAVVVVIIVFIPVAIVLKKRTR